MYAYIRGILAETEEDAVVVEAGGIGYRIYTTGQTYGALPPVGGTVRIYTYQQVREDAVLLFGFLTKSDLEIFRKCITVSGIGPKGALAILSVLDADSLRFAIMSGDVKAISRAPGIGPRTAERLILELKDKIRIDDTLIDKEIESLRGKGGEAAGSSQKKEAVEALVSLGYGQAEAAKAVSAIEGIEAMDSGDVLKAALKNLF